MAQDRLEKCVWSPTDKRVAAYLTPVWGDIPAKRWWPSAAGGKLWLQERTPEQLKGDGR